MNGRMKMSAVRRRKSDGRRTSVCYSQDGHKRGEFSGTGREDSASRFRVRRTSRASRLERKTCQSPGIGRVKSIQILCIAELARRMAKETAAEGLDFSSPERSQDTIWRICAIKKGDPEASAAEYQVKAYFREQCVRGGRSIWLLFHRGSFLSKRSVKAHRP